ncbi:D-Ala-D-Ala carboxypeptidase family metallohydrolase [Mesorhizobium sp. CC13]|uniref:YcbK family protein n=1 Tax=Mesorhizobium sp. CC13 TaxID=3029194 RepID=UPI00326672AC
MTSGRLRPADWRYGVALTVLVSLAAASCTSTGEPSLEVANASSAATATTEAAGTPEAAGSPAAATAQADTNLAMNTEGGTALPDQVGYVPVNKPGTESAAASALEKAEQPQQAATATEAEPSKAAEATQVAEANPEKPSAQQDNGLAAGAATEAPQQPKKKGFLASLFSSSPAKSVPAKEEETKPLIATTPAAAQSAAPKAPEEKAKPIITLASTKANSKQVAMASLGGSSGGDSDWALPGVRTTDLFEIKRKSGINDDSDVDLNEGDDDGSYEVASAAGLARLAPNGLLKQNDNVDVSCLKPSLVRVLKAVEQRFGTKMIVTSGFRDPERNRRVGGAKKSLHMACAAADIQVPGVGKWELATFLRSMPDRGGVGTYCSTNSVHVDVGPERDWNWRCGRRG